MITMGKMKMFMKHTGVSAARSIAEIRAFLARAGATDIMESFRNGVTSSLTFCLEVHGQRLPFTLPARTDKIYQLLHAERDPRRLITEDARKKAAAIDRERAANIAWRQLSIWVQAQFALVETELAQVDEVFMPYIRLKGGQTLYELQAGNGFKMLPKLED